MAPDGVVVKVGVEANLGVAETHEKMFLKGPLGIFGPLMA
jgi:hypothetical protein